MLNDLKKAHEVTQENEQEARHTAPVAVYVQAAVIIVVVACLFGAVLQALAWAGY